MDKVLSINNVTTEVVKWAEKKGFEMTKEKSIRAAFNGRLSVLEYFRYKLPDSKKLCENAAQNGQLETLKALRSWGMPMGISATRAAFSGQHWEVLKWLIQNGCEYNHMELRYDIPNPLFQWLQGFENGANFDTSHYDSDVEYYDCIDEFDDD